MTWVVGDTVTFIATFLNVDGTPATGLVANVSTQSSDAQDRIGAAISFPSLSSWSEIGTSGRYKATAVPVAAGRYTVVAKMTPVTTHLPYEIVEDVEPALDPVIPAVTVVSVPASADPISIVAGDAASLSWQSTDWADLTDATVTFQAWRLQTGAEMFDPVVEVIVTNAGEATQTVSIALDGTDTDAFRPGLQYRYEINATLSDTSTVTLAHGPLSARDA